MCRKENFTIRYGKQSVVTAPADIKAWIYLGSSLTDNYVAGSCYLTAKQLYPKTFSVAVSSVS